MAQGDKIVATLHEKYDGNISRRPDTLHELLGAMRDYEAFCADNDLPAFPATELVAVRYLLARTAGGDLKQHHVSRRAFLIGKLHEETRHPPRNLGERIFNAYNRAISFSTRRLRDKHEMIVGCKPEPFRPTTYFLGWSSYMLRHRRQHR